MAEDADAADGSREGEEEQGTESEPENSLNGRSPNSGSKRKRGSKHHVYKPWTGEEDALLLSLVDELGASNWQDIAKAIPNRTAKSCRLRYVNQLRSEIVAGPFTPEEDALLLQYHLVHGNKWTLVAKHLNGRTDNQVKNRWHSWLKKQPGVGVSPPPPAPPQDADEVFLPDGNGVLPGAWVPVPATTAPSAPATAAGRINKGQASKHSGGGAASGSSAARKGKGKAAAAAGSGKVSPSPPPHTAATAAGDGYGFGPGAESYPYGPFCPPLDARGMSFASKAPDFASAGSATSPLLQMQLPGGMFPERVVSPGLQASHSAQPGMAMAGPEAMAMPEGGAVALSAAELTALTTAAAAWAANSDEVGASAAAEQLQLYARMQQRLARRQGSQPLPSGHSSPMHMPMAASGQGLGHAGSAGLGLYQPQSYHQATGRASHPPSHPSSDAYLSFDPAHSPHRQQHPAPQQQVQYPDQAFGSYAAFPRPSSAAGGVSSNPQLAVNRPYEVVSLLDDDDQMEVEEGGGQVGGGKVLSSPAFLPAPEPQQVCLARTGSASRPSQSLPLVQAAHSGSGGSSQAGSQGHQQQQSQQEAEQAARLSLEAKHTAPARSSSASPPAGHNTAAVCKAAADTAAVGRVPSPFVTAPADAAHSAAPGTILSIRAERLDSVHLASAAPGQQLAPCNALAPDTQTGLPASAAPTAPWAQSTTTAPATAALLVPRINSPATAGAMGGSSLSSLLISSLENAAAKAASSLLAGLPPGSRTPPIKLEDPNAATQQLQAPPSFAQSASFLEAQQAAWSSGARSITPQPALLQPQQPARSATPQPAQQLNKPARSATPQPAQPQPSTHHVPRSAYTGGGGDTTGGSSAQPSSQASHEGGDGGDGSAPEHPASARERAQESTRESARSSRAALDRATTINTLASMGVDPAAAALLVDASYNMPVGAMLQPDMQVLLLRLLPPAAAAAAAASAPAAPTMAPSDRAQMDRAMAQLQRRLRPFLQPQGETHQSTLPVMPPAPAAATGSNHSHSVDEVAEVTGSRSFGGNGQLQPSQIHGGGYMHAPATTAAAVRFPPPLVSNSGSDHTSYYAMNGGNSSYGSSAAGAAASTDHAFSGGAAAGGPHVQQPSPVKFLDGFPTPPASLLNGSFSDLFNFRDMHSSHDALFQGSLMPATGTMGSGFDLPCLPHDFLDKGLSTLPSPTGSRRPSEALLNGQFHALQHASSMNVLQRGNSISILRMATATAATETAAATSAASSSYSCPPSGTSAAGGGGSASAGASGSMVGGGSLSMPVPGASSLHTFGPSEQLPLPGSMLSLPGSEVMLNHLCLLPSNTSLPNLLSSSSLQSLLPPSSSQGGLHTGQQTHVRRPPPAQPLFSPPTQPQSPVPQVVQHEIKQERG